MKLTSSAKVVPDRAKPTTQPVPWPTFRPRGHDFYNVVQQQQQQQQRKVVELQTTSGKLHHHASGAKGGAAGIDWTKLEVLLRAPLPSNTPQMMPSTKQSFAIHGLTTAASTTTTKAAPREHIEMIFTRPSVHKPPTNYYNKPSRPSSKGRSAAAARAPRVCGPRLSPELIAPRNTPVGFALKPVPMPRARVSRAVDDRLLEC